MRFTWDPRKAASNLRKHAESAAHRVLVTVAVELGEDEARISSARKATERRLYEEGEEET